MFATAAARSRNAAAASPSPSETIGSPSSPPVRTAGSSGSDLRYGTSTDSASVRPPALAEYLVSVPAARADEPAHVLDDAQHVRPVLPEHLNASTGVAHGDGLRRRDDDRPRHGEVLKHRQLDVARPRRQVHHEVVELPPRHVLEEVGERVLRDRSELTDRQREAARTAHFAGFFEWPREHTGEEVASMMDISQTTFTQHLRAAENKLFAALFDDTVTVS